MSIVSTPTILSSLPTQSTCRREGLAGYSQGNVDRVLTSARHVQNEAEAFFASAESELDQLRGELGTSGFGVTPQAEFDIAEDAHAEQQCRLAAMTHDEFIASNAAVIARCNGVLADMTKYCRGCGASTEGFTFGGLHIPMCPDCSLKTAQRLLGVEALAKFDRIAATL